MLIVLNLDGEGPAMLACIREISAAPVVTLSSAERLTTEVLIARIRDALRLALGTP